MSASEKKGIVQFIQFILVGVLNTLVDLVVTRLLQVGFGLLTNQLLLTYYIPKVIGYACGIVNSYVLNTAWTFQKERKRDAREIISSFLRASSSDRSNFQRSLRSRLLRILYMYFWHTNCLLMLSTSFRVN